MTTSICSLNYQFEENEDNKLRPVLVFLHGFLGSLSDWDYHISHLRDRFRCIAIDLPGHGKSINLGSEECYNFKKVSASIIDILDRNRIDKCILTGYSMGGRLALFMAVEYPDRYTGLVIESASPGLKTENERKKRYRDDLKIAEELNSSPLDSFLQRWYDQPVFLSLKSHPDFADLMKTRMRNIPSELAQSLRNMSIGCQPELWSKWESIGIPSLLIAGENDSKFVAILSEMEDSSKFSRINIVADCGHNIHFENKNTYIKVLRKFLESLEEV